jgi:hypothetical protein
VELGDEHEEALAKREQGVDEIMERVSIQANAEWCIASTHLLPLSSELSPKTYEHTIDWGHLDSHSPKPILLPLVLPEIVHDLSVRWVHHRLLESSDIALLATQAFRPYPLDSPIWVVAAYETNDPLQVLRLLLAANTPRLPSVHRKDELGDLAHRNSCDNRSRTSRRRNEPTWRISKRVISNKRWIATVGRLDQAISPHSALPRRNRNLLPSHFHGGRMTRIKSEIEETRVGWRIPQWRGSRDRGDLMLVILQSRSRLSSFQEVWGSLPVFGRTAL